MIFTMDIGNTNIKTGLFQGKELVRYWRLSTNRSSTSDEYGMLVTNLFRSAGLSPDQVTGIMLSSVVRLLWHRAQVCGAGRKNGHQHSV